MKTVKEIMVESPKHCEPHESLQNVITEMSKYNIGSMPVVNDSKKVIGVITDHDICVKLGKTNKTISQLSVHEAMSSEAHTCKPEDSASTVLKIMRTKKVGRVPVVDKEGHLKGVVSLMGIIRKIKDSREKAELEYKGEENIINTLHSLANRKQKLESAIEEFTE